ncbi:MAG TPA: non-ribosomal peptide synthetase [Roseomonas sp.]|jgi:amino acid adenylation domain-containing protein
MTSYPHAVPPRSVAEAFARQVRAAPDAVALRWDGGWQSYAALAARAAGIARRLAGQGVQHGDRVGVVGDVSPDLIAALIGVLQAGAAYVPFDSAQPAAAQARIAEDCAPRLFLLADAADPPAPGVPVLRLGEVTEAAADAGSQPPGDPEDLAYVMYTSGSTGQPKGVMVPHRGILRLVLGADYAALGPGETILQLAPLGFDAATFEIWGSLLTGGTLALPDIRQRTLDGIGGTIARLGVTTLWLTAGLFHAMAGQRPEALRPLRQLLAGGDVLAPSAIERVLATCPELRLINGYGPTENTTFTCCHAIPAGWHGEAVPIGRPIAGTTVRLLDAELRPVPAGEVGELCTGGAGVALGYLNRPELTAAKFVPDAGNPGALLYRTGDLARLRPDGAYEFLGRVDRQIKINGRRIELEGVEAAIRGCPGVREAAVVVEGAGTDHKWLVAYVVGASAAAVSGHLAALLPGWMLPASYIMLDRLPLTPSGKVDRGALPAVQAAEAPAAVAPAPLPRDATVEALAAIWRRVLGRDSVGFEDNFFDLGCTSLQIVEAQAAIVSDLGQSIELVDMFAHPSIAKLAAYLAAPSQAKVPSQRATRQVEAMRRLAGNRRTMR